VEPLDEQADSRDYPVYRGDDTDENPVENPDKQFQAICIIFEGEELFR
jgi:hypothetical protein